MAVCADGTLPAGQTQHSALLHMPALLALCHLDQMTARSDVQVHTVPTGSSDMHLMPRALTLMLL